GGDGDEGSAGAPTTVPATFPGESWGTVGPVEAGFDPDGLARLADAAEAAGSRCLVVVRDGKVVLEEYWQGSGPDVAQEAWSVTKSVTSTLVGIARDEGHLDLSDPAADHIPEWRGTPAEAVTIENLLSNDSGRHWDLGTDYAEMALGARDKSAFAIGLAQDHPPGEVWAYNNSAIQTLSPILASATGEDPVDYARTRLFEPLDMDHTRLSTDGAGNAMTYAGLQTTCLDLARFGHLWLHDGNWAGEQIVSADYVEMATGRPSTPLNAAYGYLWWINHEGPIAGPLLATTGAPDDATGDSAPDTRLVPGAPDDAFWALGMNNQMVAVLPSVDVVAVRLGAKPPAEAPFTQTELTTGVLDALIEP
ncbi:MAG TPA: serine hydrolase, partial [Acidimicrobiales bacterium]